MRLCACNNYKGLIKCDKRLIELPVLISVLASVRQSTQLHLINGLLILEEEEVDDQLQPITKSANRKSIVREKQITNIDSSGSSNDDDVDNVPVFGSVSNYLAGAANRPGDHNWTENFIKGGLLMPLLKANRVSSCLSVLFAKSIFPKREWFRFRF